MLNAESKQLEELLKSFTNAEQRVRTVLLTTKAGDVEELKVKLDKKLDKISLSLTEKSKKWAEKDLPHAYDEGVQKINGKRDKVLHQSDNTIFNSYIELSTKVQTATDHAKEVINNAIKEAESRGGYGATVGNVKDIIQETLYKENASMVVQYSNGANMPLPAYAQMLARTSRIESSNTGSFDRCKQLGIDLVRCTTMPGCCPYCKKYEGKVYSISGKDTRFPALYETALQHGYNIMHPNCRHEFIPFVEAMQDENELKSIIKESNTFKELSKDDKIFKKYNEDQAKMRYWRTTFNEFNKLKSYYGEQFPYKTLGGFRRAWNVNSATLRTIRNYNNIDAKGGTFHRDIDYFSQEERDKAWLFNNKFSAHNKFLTATKAIWSKLDNKEKVALTRYTEDSYDYANALRDSNYLSKLPEFGRNYIKKNLDLITDTLDKCELPASITLRRVVKLDVVAEKYFKTNTEQFVENIRDLGYYKDSRINDKSFVSTSASFDATYGASYEKNAVVLEIYAPKNSKGLYVEPFSYYGGNKKDHIDINEAVRVWDGIHDSGKPGREVEVILQRDCDFKVKGMHYDKENLLHIELDLIRQGGKDAK